MKQDPRLLSIEEFDYELPSERIALAPWPVRHESKLLCYKKGVISDHHYINLDALLPSKSFVVFNQTKVIPARVLFEKSTGGVIEIFCLQPDVAYGEMNNALQETSKVILQCFVGGASKWKPGVALLKRVGSLQLQALVLQKNKDHFLIEFSWTPQELTLAAVLDVAGATPLPPYIKRPVEKKDRESYQTVYAKKEGSVAAPTAGLHFTQELFDRMQARQIDYDFLTLHVGAGTFKPVNATTMQEHDMHSEWIDVTISFLKNWQAKIDQPLIAVGTTSLRTLESLYWLGIKLMDKEYQHPPTLSQWECYSLQQKVAPLNKVLDVLIEWMEQRGLQHFVTQTSLLVAPGYRCQVINGLLTNFHQPRSTLLLLIAALVGEDWRKIYTHALDHHYRFLSFGDGSLLWRNDQ
ncbi:MAG: S-adenosylmethionine:tRNA ribosyltransferase-isomerase [Sphingomonadales bacterium]